MLNENLFSGNKDKEWTWNLSLKHVTIMTLTLSQHGWIMGSAQHLTEKNILPKLNENLLKGSGDMEGPQNARLKDVTFNCDLKHVTIMTLTLSQHGWIMGSAQHLTEKNILPKLNENLLKGSGDMEGPQNARLKDVTFNCDLYLGQT